MKILIVEDDPISLKIMTQIAATRGYQTRGAVDGVDGLKAFQEFAPDLIISDIQMPGMNGLQLLAEVRKRNANTLVVIVTGLGLEEHAVKALRLRANNYICKPFDKDELLRLLGKYDSIMNERAVDREILGMIVQREFTMVINNNLAQVPAITDYLMRETRDALEKDASLSVHLALHEMLTNAIEHGNLGITYDDKSRALAGDANEWPMLCEERMKDPVLGARKVTIQFKLDTASCEWLISDQGTGFDWKAIPSPTEGPGLLECHGRGIFLSQLHLDELEYMGAGNVVRLKKARRSCIS